jgi:galactonate dehydratase
LGETLRITEFDAFHLREPVSRRRYTVVRIRTASGATGYGECAALTAAEVATARRALLGREATALEEIAGRLETTSCVQAGVNMAMLDAVGKHTKAPVYQLLGGPTRNKVRAMARLSGRDDSEFLASLRRGLSNGFRAFIVPIPAPAARNQGQAFVHSTLRRMDALRNAAGEDVDFVLDGAGGLSPGDAASLTRALERFHLLWLDEPVESVSLGALRKLSAESVTPVGFGRDVRRQSEFLDLLREDAIDVLRPDISMHGVTRIRKAAALAETYYVAVAPFHEGGPIVTAAALHLAASLPNFFIQQIPSPDAEEDRRMRAELVEGVIETVRDGFAELPVRPGLGIEVNEKALEKYKEDAA